MKQDSTMKRLISLLVLALAINISAMAKSEKATVLFSVNLHCDGCVSKIEKNIAFEKGVKDLQCDLKKKTVLVTFDPSKTSVEALQKAFEKIGKPATTLEINGKKPDTSTAEQHAKPE